MAGSRFCSPLLLLMVAVCALSSPFAAAAEELHSVVPLDQRYEFTEGVRRMWVYSTDKPINTTHPGGGTVTEIKINVTYSSGEWELEGDMRVPAGTSGASVMQLFGAAAQAAALMLHVYDGPLAFYHVLTKVLAGNIYDRWMGLNVVHDEVAAGNVTVFVDGAPKLGSARGHGGTAAHYFKFGVSAVVPHGVAVEEGGDLQQAVIEMSYGSFVQDTL